MNGNVGIGTWVPSQQLVVEGSNVTQVKIITDSTSNQSSFQLFDSTTANNIFNVRLNPSGAANAALNSIPLSGSILTSTGSTGGLILGAQATGASLSLVTGGTVFGTNQRMLIDGNGNIGIGTINPQSKFQINNIALPFIVNSNSNVGIGTTTPVGGLVVMNGNVGIGTWVPGQALTIGAALTDKTIATLAVKQGSSGAGIVSEAPASDKSLRIFHNGSIGVISSTYEATGGYTPLVLETSDLEKLRIDTFGNVGIGTVTPLYFLDIFQGSDANEYGLHVKTSNTSANSGAKLVYIDSSTVLSNDASSYPIYIKTQASDPSFSVNNNGVVSGSTFSATGGSSVTQPLTVTTTDTSGSTGIALATIDSSPVVSNVATSWALQVKTQANAGSLIITNGGNVGIGTTLPTQALDVVGTVRGLSAGACTFLYKCVGGVDAGVIQTSACNLCPGGSCTQMNGCF